MELVLLDGITKVIDELGLIILSKEIEIELKDNELKKLKEKIEAMEQYISFYDEYYSREKSI